MSSTKPDKPAAPKSGKAPATKGGKAEPAWGAASAAEPASKIEAQIAIMIAAVLNFLLPGKYTLGPPWLVPLIEVAMLIPLFFSRRQRLSLRMAGYRRATAMVLISIVNVANVVSLYLLIRHLLFDTKGTTGKELFYSAIAIWVTNVIVFALWFWELDRGGPDERCREEHPAPDFLFPQMITPSVSKAAWSPAFLDYLYVSFTNATAFSPTDTMPLTGTAKTLMMIEATASLLTIAVVASRGIGIL